MMKTLIKVSNNLLFISMNIVELERINPNADTNFKYFVRFYKFFYPRNDIKITNFIIPRTSNKYNSIFRISRILILNQRF